MEIDNNSNEELSNLVLNNDKMKNVTKLQRRPKEGCTHVIVDSPILFKNKELVKEGQIKQDLMDQITALTLNQG